jgi:magnesium transporter
MIEYFHKKGSRYLEGSSKNYSEFRRTFKSNEFLCMLIQVPGEEDVEGLCKDFKLNPRPFKKFRNETRSMRYSFNPLMFTLTDYHTDNNKIKVSKLLFVVHNKILIMITSEYSNYYKELFDRVVKNAHIHKKYSTGYILYEFLHEDAKDNYNVLELMEDRIQSLEQKVLSDIHEKAVTHDIMALKKELAKMSKRLWASSKVIFTIKRDLTAIKLTKEDQALLDDIYDTFLHQIDMVETLKETVTDYLEIFTTTISNRLAITSNELNIVMKKMTALTIIIMVPTLIAGIYGMNYRYMPELGWKYGYLFSIGLMIVTAWMIYGSFHRKKWI